MSLLQIYGCVFLNLQRLWRAEISAFLYYTSLPLQFLRISVHDQKSKNKLLNSIIDFIGGTRFIKKINMFTYDFVTGGCNIFILVFLKKNENLKYKS